MFDHGWLAVGECVLIHGALGVVGGYAVQFVCACGAYVIGIVLVVNLGLVCEFGVHEVVDGDMRIEEVDVVFDIVGGERLCRLFEVLCFGG